jgi:para-nitrobenzyl esterase
VNGRRTLAVIWGSLALAVGGVARADDALVAHVDGGRLRGHAEGPAIAFKGIAYAAPPVGTLRWAPPRAPAPWDGVKDAGAFGPVCPQKVGPRGPALAQSEACLTLNVWRPASVSTAAPVMVWLHGGGDVAGTASQPQFDGAPFARDGVVFVSVEYRLGALGWFAHPGLTRSATPGAPLANYGLMDQIAALRWVQRNIAAFGGDRRRVTLAGESAGAEAVLLLMTTPAARGLFAQAIVESAPGWVRDPDLAHAEADGEALARRAGAPAGASAVALRALPFEALLAAQDDEMGPAIDGRLVDVQPADAFAAGRSAAVPLLIGSNNGEDNLLGGGDPKAVLAPLSASDRESLRAAYGAEASDDALFGRLVFRDSFMGAPARWIAARQAPRAPTFLYRFDYLPGVVRLRLPRARHGMEMLFVFEAMDRAPIPLPATPGDQDEMTKVHGCWVAFVEAGRPDCPGGPAWPPYDPRQDRLMLFGDATTAIVPDPLAGVYAILDRLDAPAVR